MRQDPARPGATQAGPTSIRAGLTQKDAALVAGIDEVTLIRWAHRHANFANQLARAHASRTADWLANIRKLAGEQRDWRAYAELLDRCAPEYRKTQKIDQTVTIDVRQAAERVAADLGVPVDTVLAETYRMVEDGA